MHPEHKASFMYKIAELGMSHSINTTEVFKIAHSLRMLRSVHSLNMLCLAAATEQVSRQRLNHQQVIEQQFRLLLAMCTSWHIWASAPSCFAYAAL